MTLVSSLGFCSVLLRLSCCRLRGAGLAQYLLNLARRAVDVDNETLVQEFEE